MAKRNHQKSTPAGAGANAGNGLNRFGLSKKQRKNQEQIRISLVASIINAKSREQ